MSNLPLLPLYYYKAIGRLGDVTVSSFVSSALVLTVSLFTIAK